MSRTCKLIKELREQTGLTASQFAKVMGVSKSSVSKWESDEVPGIEHLYQIARYFRVSVDELLNGVLDTDSNMDRFVADYDLSSFDVKKLLQDKNSAELVHYYKKCQNIKNKYLKLLPKAAYHGLKDVDLAEYHYISKYICVNSEVIKYERNFDDIYAGKLDSNEMKAVKEFYESIKGLPKAEREWEIEKIYIFQRKLYVKEIIESHLFEPFIEMFKLLIQVDKNAILNNSIDRRYPMRTIRNRYILEMINNGAKVLHWDGWHSSYWDEEVIKAFDGEIRYVDRKKQPPYKESEYYNHNGDCSYSKYLEVVDEEKTKMFKEACQLRKTKPIEYYKQLKSGAFNLLLDF